MKQELIKPIIKVGNSAGVILPKGWINGEARIELIKKPLDIKKEILEFLEPYLQDVEGIYLAGSYARGEQTKESDIDVLVITSDINKRINKGNYSIIMISEKKLKDNAGKAVLPLVPMIIEAKTLLNNKLIKKISADIGITKGNTRPIIELAKSALGVNRSFLDLDRDWPSNAGDATAYSLILNIRSLYLINCLIKNKKWSSKEFRSIIKNTSGSLKAYEGYIRIKNNNKAMNELPLNEAERLYSYLKKQIEEAEKWLKGKKD